MNTKTMTTLALVGGLAYMGYRAKQAAEAVAAASFAAAPLPPNSGPVVNGLSFYQLEGLGGIGSKLKKATKKAVSQVKKVSNNKIVAVATGGASLLTAKGISVLEKKSPVFSPLIKKVSKTPDKTPAASGQETVYYDINGVIITKAQYDAIVLAMQTGQNIATSGGWALPAGYIVQKNPYQTPNTIKPGYNADGSLITPSINQGTAPVDYVPQPNEQLVVTDYQDSDYGLPSAPGTQYTADSTGSPGLPGGVTTEVSTPSAEEAAAMAAPQSNTGKLLIGTALAAGAAYLAFG